MDAEKLRRAKENDEHLKFAKDLIESESKLKSYCIENGHHKPCYKLLSKDREIVCQDIEMLSEDEEVILQGTRTPPEDEGLRSVFTFEVSVLRGDYLINAEGEGFSKRIARRVAALNLLNKLNCENNN